MIVVKGIEVGNKYKSIISGSQCYSHGMTGDFIKDCLKKKYNRKKKVKGEANVAT